MAGLGVPLVLIDAHPRCHKTAAGVGRQTESGSFLGKWNKKLASVSGKISRFQAIRAAASVQRLGSSVRMRFLRPDNRADLPPGLVMGFGRGVG
jgi:hypothetical protein